jgi:ribonuclease HII
MLIAGIDEAGRGPVLGPLVLAVCCIHKKDEEKLVELGVRDSKLLSASERERQFLEIKNIAREFNSIKIQAKEIDLLRNRKSLNEIEAMRIGFLLNELKEKPEIVFVDSPDLIERNFAERIKKYLSFNCIIKSEHKADLNYPVVSAASIIAKVERDNEIKKLEEKYGKLGSGYPGDEFTERFLAEWVKENGSLPDFARNSWHTSQRVLSKRYQKKLF